MGSLHGVRPSAHNLENIIWRYTELGRRVSGVQLLQTNTGRVIGTSVIRQFFARYDILLTPTIATPPPPLTTLSLNDDADPLEWVQRMFSYMPFTPAFNMTGNPAISLPLGESSDGVPIGVQLVGRFGDEATLFRLSAQLELAMPWRERLPQVHAAKTVSA
jgi:amidase